MKSLVLEYVEPNIAACCADQIERLERQGAMHDEAVEFQFKLFQATAPDVFVGNWIADPAADLAQVYRCLVVFGDDVTKLGQSVKNLMLNRMKEAAEFTVSQGE